MDHSILAYKGSVYARFINKISEIVEAFTTHEFWHSGHASIYRGILHDTVCLGSEPVRDHSSLGGFDGREQLVIPTAFVQLFAKDVKEIFVGPEYSASLQRIFDAPAQGLEAAAELDECIG